MNDEHYMNIAFKEALKAFNKDEIPVGCVIVKNNKIIAKAHNKRELRMNVLEHAELSAISNACKKISNWRLLDCTIYVTMLPCPMCAGAINQSRISKVVYGTIPDNANYSLIEKILADNKYGQPVKIVGGVLKDECSKIIKDFFQKKR